MISVEELKFFPFFSNLNPALLGEVAKISREVSLESREYLFEEDQPAEYLYLVKTGSLSLNMKVPASDGKEYVKELDPMQKGELVGWSSIIGKGYYYFSVVANTPVTLLQVESKGLKRIMQNNPETGYDLIYKIADVIRERLEMKCMQLLSLAAA